MRGIVILLLSLSCFRLNAESDAMKAWRKDFGPVTKIDNKDLNLASKSNSKKDIIISIPSDSKATYIELDRSNKGNIRTLKTKRTGPSGDSFAIVEFDCKSQTSRYIADSDTLDGLKESVPEPRRSPIISQSIAYFQMLHICR